MLHAVFCTILSSNVFYIMKMFLKVIMISNFGNRINKKTCPYRRSIRTLTLRQVNVNSSTKSSIYQVFKTVEANFYLGRFYARLHSKIKSA